MNYKPSKNYLNTCQKCVTGEDIAGEELLNSGLCDTCKHFSKNDQPEIEPDFSDDNLSYPDTDKESEIKGRMLFKEFLMDLKKQELDIVM